MGALEPELEAFGVPDGGIAGDDAIELHLPSLALAGRLPGAQVRQGVEPDDRHILVLGAVVDHLGTEVALRAVDLLVQDSEQAFVFSLASRKHAPSHHQGDRPGGARRARPHASVCHRDRHDARETTRSTPPRRRDDRLRPPTDYCGGLTMVLLARLTAPT